VIGRLLKNLVMRGLEIISETLNADFVNALEKEFIK
jgi:hypothetical protein